MAEAIQMPKLGFDMAEGTLVNWVKQVGDRIEQGEVIAEIETDKATLEIESTVSGTILKLLAEPGDAVPVGEVIAYVGEEGEAVPEAGAAPAAAAKAETAPEAAQRAPQAEAEKPETAASAAPAAERPAPPPPSEDGKGYPGGVKVSPLARRIAEEKGIDLRQVTGTGPGGRIVRKDVEEFRPPAREAAPAAPGPGIPAAATYGELPGGPDVEVVETSKLRRRIGQRMTLSKQQVPHFYVTTEMDVEALLALRQQLNASLPEDAPKITVNDLIVKAAALTLRRFPNLNAHFYGENTVRHKRINIGIAVALPEGGLINVVAHDADKIALGALATANKEKIARAREGRYKPEDVEGSTFTVSNLGPYQVEHFAAIINPPEAAILAIGEARRVPVVKEDGTLGIGTRMKVTISVDHRVSDGAEAAEFLQEMKRLIENPMGLLI